MAPSCSRAPKPITVYTGEWTPYVTRTNDNVSRGVGSAYGMTADIVTMTLHEMGYEPLYEFRDWTVVDALIREGRVDAAFPFVRAASREAAFSFSDPLLEVSNVLFYNIEAFDGGTDLASARGKRLGLIQGYEYGTDEGPDFRESFGSLEIIDADEVEGFRRLITGEIDVLPAEERVGRQILETNFLARMHRIGILDGFRRDVGLRLAIPRTGSLRKRNRFLAEFNLALGRIRDRGAIDSVVKAYTKKGTRRNEVILRSPPGEGIIGLRRVDSAPEPTPCMIPHGTRAVVVEWSPPFEPGYTFAPEEPWPTHSTVRILEGPLRGQVVRVPNGTIAFRP